MRNMEEKLKKYQELVEITRTTEDVAKLEEEIDLLLQAIYQTDRHVFEEVLDKMVRMRVAMELRRLIQQEKNYKKEDLKALLSDAFRTICGLPILGLILAFEPSEDAVGIFSSWARSNLARGVLLDLSLDRGILGGAVIMYNGRIYDFTVRKKLNEIFEKGDIRIVVEK